MIFAMLDFLDFWVSGHFGFLLLWYRDIRKKPLQFNCTIDLNRKEAKTVGSYQYRVHEYCAKVMPYIRYMQNQEKSLVHGLRQLLIHDLYSALPELNPDYRVRKLTNDKRPVVDFRLLNTRIVRRNTSIPLMSDVLSILGNSECEVVSCVDIKDAYHSIKLTEKSKYCGILPYFGSPIYRYEVLPMGIACAPQIWMDYITLN